MRVEVSGNTIELYSEVPAERAVLEAIYNNPVRVEVSPSGPGLGLILMPVKGPDLCGCGDPNCDEGVPRS